MSIAERIKAEHTRRSVAQELQSQTHAELLPTLQAKYESEFPEMRDVQGALLENLREAGLISLIEEVIGRKIPPLKEQDEQKVRKATLRSEVPSEEVFNRARTLHLPQNPWSLFFPFPEISYETSEWDPALGLLLEAGEDDGLMMLPKYFVLIHFTPDKELTIRGERSTFAGPIPSDLEESVGIFENALVAAFVDPLSSDIKDHPSDETGFVGRNPLNLPRQRAITTKR